MSIEPTDTSSSDIDDRSDSIPQGGFAPIGDLDAAPSIATMPPPPGTWNPALHDATDEGDVWADEGFPPTDEGFPRAMVSRESAPQPRPAPGEPAAKTDAAPDNGFVLFGGEAAAPRSERWTSDDDADLILPIEPSRLGRWDAPRGQTADDATAPGDADASAGGVEPIDETPLDEIEGAGRHVGDAGRGDALALIVAHRLERLFAPLVERRAAFLADDVDHVSTGWIPGSVVCLAGSEVAIALDDAPEDTLGVAISIGAPHHIAMGVGFPIELVADGSHVEALGSIDVTAVAGSVDISLAFSSRVDGGLADELVRMCSRLADDIEQARVDRTVSFTEVTLDAAGGIRVAVDRT